MSLDLVEFIQDVEETFGVGIPNRVAERIVTPRMLIDYIFGQLPEGIGSGCPTQRAFYRVRRAVADCAGGNVRNLRPGTRLVGVLPGDGQAAWAAVGERFPPSVSGRWRDGWFGLHVRIPPTLGDAARQVAAYSLQVLKPAGEGWTWAEVERGVRRLMREHLAVGKFSLDDRFVEDLGLG